MKMKILVPLALAAALASGAKAQNSAPTGAINPSPAPTVVPATPAPAAPIAAPAANTPAPTQVVYAPRLPSATELMNVASAQGLTVERIEQNATQVVATYKNANGQVNVVAYQLLPNAGAATAQPVATASPAPRVVYVEPAPRVVYYDAYDPYYYPRYWYPPVSLSLGFGYSHFGGGFHRGFGGFRR
ncbi:MAG TPA: hypothetical protein VHD62_17890 [Opitutaceae bacterium]|nr:hypothetical protein [Opitutaceae bacterium]